MASKEEDPSVRNFREYVRCKTVHPNPDYSSCTEFLKRQARELGADVQVIEMVPKNPIVIMTLPGRDLTLPTILLNSHTDVVPVYPEHWKYDPFSAHKDEEGNIYGRGTQDMKCVGMQYIEALKRLKSEGHTFLRTIHLSFVPDEEVTGLKGMKPFVKSPEFEKLNIGFALDEGYANEGEEFFVFYGERGVWNVYVKCEGQPGHGSQFLEDTAGEKVRKVINSFLSYRDEQEEKMKNDPKLELGEVNTVNLTIIKGGVQFNVIPAELTVGFNIRVTPLEDADTLEEKMRGWCSDAGPGVTLNFDVQITSPHLTSVEDGKSIWWDAFSAACKKEDIKLIKKIFPAATDSRYIRRVGIPALGFSPMNHTPLLLHDHNEYLNENIYLRGIEIYKTIITSIANVKG